LDLAIGAGQIAIGSPDEVAKSIETYAATGADQLSFGMLSTSMSLETCEEAVETFGKYVLPNYDKDPIHSTTRQRMAAVAH
jgi:alkanesulfonate monooxygenase SsuD/methylene tetrahydromethanopterin reductase-like flavin-dependent oxidoreductase (luciferase family)